MFRSRVNQPTRAFINSNDDTSQAGGFGFSSFAVNFQTPILNAKKLQLLRATIPNCQINIPNYCLQFFYYNLPTATTAPADQYLRCIRLYPSTWVAPAAYATYSKNRYFSDPADFVTALNTAAAVGGDSVVYNPYWAAGEGSFAYNASTKQITFTGTAVGRYFAIAGWNDPIVLAAMAGTGATGQILLPNYTGGSSILQPTVPQFTLNLRVGYAMSGQSVNTQGTPGNPIYANLTNNTFATTVGIPPDSFPNLVYSSSVYLYSDIVAGSSIGSGTQHNLLAVIPSNAPQLGVISYVAATLTWLDKIPDTIYECRIQMFDENNQPFVLPDSAVVNVEFGFTYTD